MGYDFAYPLFAMYEKKKKDATDEVKARTSMVKVTIDEAAKMNKSGYGIFWCVNMAPESKDRIASDLANVDIKYQYIDMDGGNKQELWIKIIESPMIPSLVVETHNGFHVYWKTTMDPKDVPTFKEIQKRLIEYFNSDKSCKDPLRVLRCPAFYQWKHEWKDGSPYETTKFFSTDLAYPPDEFLSTFLPSQDEVRVTTQSDREAFMNYKEANSLNWSIYWDKFLRMDQKELLYRLSGTDYVNREQYSFLKNQNGTEQIRVNGVSTSCFIKGNEIIADRGYGNNIFNWLRWKDYNNSDKDIIGILKHLVPEIFKEN